MASGLKLPHGDISVLMDEKDIDVTSEAVPAMKSSEGFVLLKAVANIFFFKKGTDHKSKANQVDKFNNNVSLEIPIPPDVLNHPTVKEKGTDILKLAYFDKNKNAWVIFKSQKIQGSKGIVNFRNWIKDPPVGWGHPD